MADTLLSHRHYIETLEDSIKQLHQNCSTLKKRIQNMTHKIQVANDSNYQDSNEHITDNSKIQQYMKGENISSNKDVHFCPMCKEEFPKRKLLNKHWKNHNGSSNHNAAVKNDGQIDQETPNHSNTDEENNNNQTRVYVCLDFNFLPVLTKF